MATTVTESNHVGLRAFPVLYALDVAATARFYERLGFQRHVRFPPEGEPGYVGLIRDGGAELAVTNAHWCAERYGLQLGDGPRVEMYVYVQDLEATVAELAAAGVNTIRDPEAMPWGERIATVADPMGNPVALCEQA